MTLRSATVSVALTIERSLAFNNETAAAPEEAQATETVALRDAIKHPGKESFDGEIARFLISHPGTRVNDFQGGMTLRSATVSVALTIERSLAFNNETAAAPEEPQATETVALRDAIEHPGKESFDGEIARFLIYHPGTRASDLQGV